MGRIFLCLVEKEYTAGSEFRQDIRRYNPILKIYHHKGGKEMHLTSFLQDGQLTIALTGEIDHHRAKGHIATIMGKIEAYNPRVCILDFHDVTFMDSSGIAVVINALRCMAKIEGSLMLSNLSAQPMKVFRASGIDKLVEIKEVTI